MQDPPVSGGLVMLASSSPRRLELLRRTGYRCVVHAPEVDESLLPSESPEEYVARVARDKASSAPELEGVAAVVSADTVVVQGDRILGKPGDEGEARTMLSGLAASMHRVMTGFVVAPVGGDIRPEVVETTVRFKPLSRQEIDCYLATGEWRDKAGGYGAQGRAAFMLQGISGSYTNVVGLPLAEVADRLARLGVLPSVEVMGAALEGRA